MVANVNQITSATTNFINEQNVQNLRIVSKYLDDASMLVERPFSSADAKPFTSTLADELTDTFVGDDTTTTRLLRHLEEHRVLLITGDRDIGKRTAALYVSVQLRVQRKVEGDPLLVDSLERNVGINLRDVAADAKAFGKRTIVFADAFEQRNNHLREFFGSGDHVGWSQLTELLRKNDAYFIFTSTSGSVPFRQQATDRIAHCELQPLKPALVGEGIDRRLNWMMAVESTARERVALLAENRARVVAELKTLSDAVSFLRHFVRDDSDLESALRRFRDASFWFRTALEHDIDAWTFAFALTLAQPARDTAAAPWADFERIRRAIAARIRGDAELFPRRRKTEDEEPEASGPACPLADDSVLERCRAVVEKDSNRLGDVVRFDHPSVAPQLWATIFTHYRRVLMMVLPVLRELAEDDRSNWTLRLLTAQIIGRIGEMDPFRIATPVMQRWAISGEYALRPLVGRVVQGALASENENYHDVAIRSVERLADVKALGEGEEARDALLTAIGAYAQIGMYEESRAMERLGAIVIEHLAPIFEKLYQSARDAETANTELSRTARLNRAVELLHRRMQFSNAATELFREHAPALIAIGQTVSQLCLAHDPVQTLRSMRDWTARGGPSTGVLVAFLFLEGIAADIHEIRGASGNNASRLLPSLATTRDAVHHFCSFLADVHASINSTFVLPAWLQNDFQERLGTCLTAWARDSLSNADYRQNVQDLFVGLGLARRGSVREDLLAVMESTAFSASESLRSFASQVRKRLATQR